MNNYFTTRYSTDTSRSRIWKIIVNHIQKKFIPNKSVICDLGAGYCDFINNVIAKEKYAVDISEEIKKYSDVNVSVHIAPLYDLKFFSAEYFDIVFSSNTLEHLTWEQIDLTINEIKRILKPSGKLILFVPNFKFCYKNFYDDYTHKTPFTETGIADWLCSKGFKILKIYPKFLPFSFKSKFPKWKFLVWIYLQIPFKLFAKQMLIIVQKGGAR